MDYELNVVPPGGGETDYIINIRGAPFIPRPGEYVVVREQEMDEEGVVSAFKIRYAVTYANRTGQEADASSDLTAVEGEPISHPHQTAAHRRNVEMYQSQGLTVEAFPESGY